MITNDSGPHTNKGSRVAAAAVAAAATAADAWQSELSVVQTVKPTSQLQPHVGVLQAPGGCGH